MLALTDIGPALAAASISLILSVDFAVDGNYRAACATKPPRAGVATRSPIPKKFKLVIKRKTASALRIEVPLDLLLAADNVIE
jgi:hypothetical protein